jgi:hypothetical protein
VLDCIRSGRCIDLHANCAAATLADRTQQSARPTTEIKNSSLVRNEWSELEFVCLALNISCTILVLEIIFIVETLDRHFLTPLVTFWEKLLLSFSCSFSLPTTATRLQ